MLSQDVRLSVCPSVCAFSHISIVLKRLKINKLFHRLVATPF